MKTFFAGGSSSSRRLPSRPFRIGLKPPSATVYADPINMRIKLATTGRLLAVVPSSILRFPAKHPSLKVLPVELPTMHRPIGIITLKNRTLSPLAQLFIEHARDVTKPLAERR